MKTALVIGSRGQDGRLLSDLLRESGYRVLGIDRDVAEGFQGTLDITDSGKVRLFVRAEKPDEIYHLAAVHESSEEKAAEGVEAYEKALSINVSSLVNFLEAMRLEAPQARLFYAASSHIFGNPPAEVQNEDTPVSPDSIYGISKAAGLNFCRIYRNQHRVFASTGILYNHESALRAPKFLSKKIILAALQVKETGKGELLLGDLGAVIDWGYAPDYVEAMHRILSAPEGGEFIIATGQKHTVQDFVREAFGALGLDWKPYVREDRSIALRKGPIRIGDPSKLMRVTGWRPRFGFGEMVHQLVQDVSKGVQNG